MRPISNMVGHLTDAEREDVQRFYELPDGLVWQPATRGLVNRAYTIDDYFLILHGRRSLAEMETIAEIAESVSDVVPIARPKRGRTSFSRLVKNVPSMLTHRLPGTHMVGLEHTDKYPIPLALHENIAEFFWRVQKQLSEVDPSAKDTLSSASVSNVAAIPSTPADENYEPLYPFSDGNFEPEFLYPDLVHDDMERQNLLSQDDTVSGLVDLDSIRMGDVLYEFAHFLFNFALCDPESNLQLIDIYINQVIQAGVIDADDIPRLYSYVFYFAISDVSEFKSLQASPQCERHKTMDIPLLVSQYREALHLALNYFKTNFNV